MKTEDLLKVYNAGISWDLHAKLCIIADEATYLFPNIDFTDCKLLEYADFELKLTKKGQDLLNLCGKPVKLNIDFVKLHEKLQQELFQLTKKKQKILYGNRAFLCNPKDLESKLLKVNKKYKLNDWVKIEKLLLQYIYTSHKANWEYVKLMEYYIEKSGISQLANDYAGFEEKEETVKKEENTQVFNL